MNLHFLIFMVHLASFSLCAITILSYYTNRWASIETRRLMLNMPSLLLPTLLLLGALLSPRLVQSFAPTTSLPRCRQLVRSSVQLDAATKATLTEETVWKIRFVLKGIETTKGKKVDEIIRIEVHFVEEEGYEPPQGTVQQIQSSEDRLKITKSYWQLSEDPNDRKGGELYHWITRRGAMWLLALH